MKYVCLARTARVLAAIDEGAFKDWANSVATPIANILIWLIPVVGLIVTARVILKWLAMEQQERDQNPLHRPLLKILGAVGIGESIPVIFKILGL